MDEVGLIFDPRVFLASMDELTEFETMMEDNLSNQVLNLIMLVSL